MQTIDLFFFEGIKRKLLIEGVQQPRFQIRQLRGQVSLRFRCAICLTAALHVVYDSRRRVRNGGCVIRDLPRIGFGSRTVRILLAPLIFSVPSYSVLQINVTPEWEMQRHGES